MSNDKCDDAYKKHLRHRWDVRNKKVCLFNKLQDAMNGDDSATVETVLKEISPTSLRTYKGGRHMTITEKQQKEMLEAAKPLIRWMNENVNPHCEAIVDQCRIKLVTYVAADKTDEFLRD